MSNLLKSVQIFPDLKGAHDPDLSYKKFDEVQHRTSIYVAAEDIPAGTDITDPRWVIKLDNSAAYAAEQAREEAEVLRVEAEAVRMGFKPMGDYNPANENKYGEWYTHEGGSYGYIYPTPSTGVPVTDTSHWQQIATMGGQDLVDAAVAARNESVAAAATLAGVPAQLAETMAEAIATRDAMIAGGTESANAAALLAAAGTDANLPTRLTRHESELVVLNNIVSFSNGNSPTITISGTTITVVFNSTMFNTNRAKTGDYKSLNITGQSFTVAHNQIMLWRLDTNEVIVADIFGANKANSIILLFNSLGTVPYGALLPFCTLMNVDMPLWCAVNPAISGTNKMPNINTAEGTLTFQAGSDILVGNAYYSLVSEIVVSLIVPNTSTFKIYFKPATMSFSVVSYSAKLPKSTYLVGYGRQGGSYKMTALFDYTIDGYEFWKSPSLVQTIDESSSRHAIVNNVAADQGMCIVRERIFVFRAGADDHSTYGNIEIYDKNTFAKIGTATHNLGHAANASYHPETDTIMVSNSNLSSAPPEIQLISSASLIAVSDVIEYTNIMAINLYEGSAGALTKDLGRTAILWAFGDSPYIVYGHAMSKSNGVVDQTKSVYYKVLLGMGTNDYSDSSHTDLTKWGTFVVGKGDNEYNGTAKIIASYIGKYAGISQGACWHDGKFYFATTTSTAAADVMAFRFANTGATMVERYLAPEINKDGSVPNQEAEGCAILDGMYLICGYRGASGQKLALFPLTNEQGGAGAVGARVQFYFKCNSIPHVFITPTGTTVDLYISSVDTEGFTVASVSGGVGNFVWRCKIS